MSIELKIKTKHMAAEGRIIKHEERRIKAAMGWAKKTDNQDNLKKLATAHRSIREHRVNVVRSHARSTHLAYSYMRGVAYRRIEDKRTKTEPNWKEVQRMVVRYSNEDERVVRQQFAGWKVAK